MTYQNNGIWEYTLDITILNYNDRISFSFFTHDSVGYVDINNNFTNLYTIKIHDFQKPSSTILFTPHMGLDIVNKTTLFSFTSDDYGGSGILEIQFRINNSNWQVYTSPFSLSSLEYGYYSISFYVVDIAGNVEEINTILVNFINTEFTAESSQAIPGYYFIFQAFILSIVVFALIKKKQLR
ncbi:hypothetical protein ES705_11584 [subsurface metagenome]